MHGSSQILRAQTASSLVSKVAAFAMVNTVRGGVYLAIERPLVVHFSLADELAARDDDAVLVGI
jgi:hypothetical protein